MVASAHTSTNRTHCTINPTDKPYKYSEHIFISDDTYEDENQTRLKLVYSGRSGKLVVVEYNDYLLIRDKVVPPLQSRLFEELKNAEIIYNMHSSDLSAIIERNQKAINNDSSLNFVILPSSFCNMGCTYCGQSHSKGGLSTALMDNIIHRITQAIHKNKPRYLDIAWFGGEPMVGYARMLKISDELIKVTNNLGINYQAKITSNGSLLTLEKLIELHERCKINEINITFDGPEAIHDKRRFLKNGKMNFINTIQLLQAALKEPRLKKLNYIFRTNIDKDNEAYIDEYIQNMYDFGFSDERIEYDLKAVYPWSNDVSNVELNKSHFAEMEKRWMTKLLKFNMKCSCLLRKNEVVCVAISPFAEVISSNGKVFSCTEFPLVPKHELQDFIGAVQDEWKGRRPNGQYDNFLEEVSTKNVPCGSCKLLGVCGGACPKHWQEGFVPCPSIKFNIQYRLNIAAIKLGYRILE